jgi:putative aldouronate transport system permease protein
MNRRADRIFDGFIIVFAVFVLAICAYPLYFVVIASVSAPEQVMAGKVVLLPKELTFSVYEYIMDEKRLWMGYRNTIFYTVGSVIFGMALTIPASYALSRKDLVGRNFIMKFLTFLMFFQGGLIPTYIIVSKLHLVNTPWILIILNCITVSNIIVTRTFFMGNIPDELMEAAFLDGCGNIKFFLSVVLPLSKTILAVMILYIAVWQWNSYFNALIYTTDSGLQPLQLILRDILIQGQNLTTTDEMDAEAVRFMMEISQMIKYGVIVVATVPIICAYPFLQKYFEKGVLIGSVKG